MSAATKPLGVLIGGPLDGGEMARAARGTFVWVAEGQPRPRGFPEPADGRALYRSTGVLGDAELFMFAGYTHALCDGCGGINELTAGHEPKRCKLCGEALGTR